MTCCSLPGKIFHRPPTDFFLSRYPCCADLLSININAMILCFFVSPNLSILANYCYFVFRDKQNSVIVFNRLEQIIGCLLMASSHLSGKWFSLLQHTHMFYTLFIFYLLITGSICGKKTQLIIGWTFVIFLSNF